MVLEFEAFREHLLQSAGASLQIEESIAGVAVEVVVMLGGDARRLVSIASAGNRNAGDFAHFLKAANHAIDGPKAEGGDRAGGGGQNLFDGQGPTGGFDRMGDGFGLFGHSLLCHGIQSLIEHIAGPPRGRPFGHASNGRPPATCRQYIVIRYAPTAFIDFVYPVAWPTGIPKGVVRVNPRVVGT